MATTLRAQLEELHALILQERECAKAMDMEAMLEATRAKEELLGALAGIDQASSDDRKLVETIQAENRRNAYLFWASLRFVRESMSFFRQQLSPVSYGAQGTTVSGRSEGMLLRGRI